MLVTTSSEFQDDGVLVRTALEALADEPVSVVATMPAGVPDDLVVPANARVERFVPHGPVLERAAVAVTHGGMGGTQKALVARRTRLRGAVRPRPARGGPAGGGQRQRDPAARRRRLDAERLRARPCARRWAAPRVRVGSRTGYRATGAGRRGGDAIERRFARADARGLS